MKYYLFTFALGLLLGLFLSFMYSTVGKLPVQVAKATAPKQLQAQVSNNEHLFIKKADSFQKKSVQLQHELILTKKELKTAKEKNASLHVAIYKLLDKTADKPLEYSNEMNCDSLVVLVGDLMQTSVLKDSLYDDTVINLEQQVSNKDSTISVKERQYTELKAAFTRSIEGQEQLMAVNKLLTKEVKKQKTKSKLTSAALLIISGAAASLLLHR
jgi:hypothetical protein